MAIAFLVVLTIAALVIAGFLLYGMYLGIARLGIVVVRVYKWLTVPGDMLRQDANPGGGTLDMSPRKGAISVKHCWDIMGCSQESRTSCPAYNNPDVPCWKAWMMADREKRFKPDCLICPLFNLSSVMEHA